jgi:hypothetical protein
MSTLDASKYRLPWPKAILFAVLAAALAWEVTSTTVVAFLANVAPEQALNIRSRQSAALLNLAQKKLDDAPSNSGLALPAIADEVRRMGEQALLSDPLNARALRLLGQIADFSKDELRSWQFMQAAARRSLNETDALGWLMSKAAERQDHAAALRYADILLRTRPQLGTEVIPVLARLAENRTAAPALKDMLIQNPPWRLQFFETLPSSITDARTLLDLLMAVKSSTAPPTTAELRSYLSFLIGRKFYSLAYYTWLQFLSPDEINHVGLVYNGNFDAVPSGLPFDWLITPGAGVMTDIDAVPDGDGNRALSVRFEDSRVDFRGVVQLVVLAPAKYHFEAAYRGTLIGQRGLRWRVICAGGTGTTIGESGMIRGISSAWKSVEFSFTVPSADCPAQYLRLDLDARMASEQFVSGQLWFDNLRISRASGAQK